MIDNSDGKETKMETPAIPTLDAQLCFAIYSAAHAFTRSYKPLLDPYGLTYPQYLVMLALWEEDGRTVKALGGSLGLDSGTLSPLLKRLEASGYIARARDRDDERQLLVTLTPRGRDLGGEAAGIRAEIGRATGCAPGVLEELTAALRRLTDNLKAGEDAQADAA